MEKNCAQGRWALAYSTENAAELQILHGDGNRDTGGEEDDDIDEEALSLSDLPLIHQSRKERELEQEGSSTPNRDTDTRDEDFDFCSLSKESEMCAADEVFFQGQILPFRHSVRSEKVLLKNCDSTRKASWSISRSESMDHYCSSGRLISSRSSSISSRQSSSSGSSTAPMGPKYKPKLLPRNQFHSHPSPSPIIRRFPDNNRQGMISTNHKNCAKKSSLWNIFRLGLVTTPPEIAFQDLKARCPIYTPTNNGNNIGSRNSTSSNSSSMISITKKRKPRALLGGCKCSTDAVDTVASKIVIIRRSASHTDVEALHQLRQLENVEAMKSPELTQKQAAKKHLSHHRTFEWLKQLSLESAADHEA